MYYCMNFILYCERNIGYAQHFHVAFLFLTGYFHIVLSPVVATVDWLTFLPVQTMLCLAEWPHVDNQCCWPTRSSSSLCPTNPISLVWFISMCQNTLPSLESRLGYKKKNTILVLCTCGPELGTIGACFSVSCHLLWTHSHTDNMSFTSVITLHIITNQDCYQSKSHFEQASILCSC